MDAAIKKVRKKEREREREREEGRKEGRKEGKKKRIYNEIPRINKKNGLMERRPKYLNRKFKKQNK